MTLSWGVWVKHFHGFHVVLLYDSDQAGREAVQNLVLPVFKPAVLAGDVLSIKVVWLYDKPDKAHKDITDWIIKDGGSGPKLKELITQAAPHTFPTPISHLEDPIVLPSFELIDRAKYAGRRVTVPLQIFGENTVAYHAPKKFTVSSCPLKRDSKCTGREGHAGACMEEIVVPLGERVLIAGVRATDGQLMNHLRAYVCDKDRAPALTIKDEDRITIREVFAHQVVGAMAAERIELVEKPIYIIGGALVEIGKYQATGRVVTSYRDQQPMMLVDTLERLEEDYQVFSLEKSRPHLEGLRTLGAREIVEDISRHITQIYERRGWRIKAGAFLKMNRQILLVDEAQDLKSEDLKTMAEGFDTGLTRIDRIQNKIFESQTRVIFNCNPRHPKKAWEQRTMDRYRYGCQAIQGIFPQMMIRRIDMVFTSTAWDVDKDKIFFPTVSKSTPQVTPESLRALVFFAWNLKPEQIIIDENTAQYIREMTKYLSDKFGGSDDLPIVYPEDFRKTMARFSVAYAILDLNTNEDFSQVIVHIGHVAEACEFLERVYAAENCQLHQYAKSYQESHGLVDLPEIRAKIDSILSGKKEKAWRLASIVCLLLKCQNGERLRKADLVDELGVGKPKIQQDMRFFTTNHLVQSTTQGYAPTPRMFRLLSKLGQTAPDVYNFEELRDRLFEELGKKGDKDDF